MARKRSWIKSREMSNSSILKIIKLFRRRRTLRSRVIRVASGWLILVLVIPSWRGGWMGSLGFEDVTGMGAILCSRRQTVSLVVLLATNGSL